MKNLNQNKIIKYNLRYKNEDELNNFYWNLSIYCWLKSQEFHNINEVKFLIETEMNRYHVN